MLKNALIYGLGLAALLASIRILEYTHIVHALNFKFYTGLTAAIFLLIGTWFGMKSGQRRKETPKVNPDVKKIQQELSITEREMEVLNGIASGMSNIQIAEQLFLSESTIKTHSSNLFSKLDVKRRTQAVQRAREIGLMT